MLLMNKELVLIDEPTSSIDREVEKIIVQLFEQNLKQKTAVIIAHKIETVLKCEKILVLE
jgi:ABC-type transport system involved in cytochrome bd biosynthesis fused ATPase/permease subunit